jgi:hypothetical protein
MRIAGILAGAAIAALVGTAAQATVRIVLDPGGQIGPYLENLHALRNSGERVIIDGPCLSACTMVLGVIPQERLCVTPRAKLGFHAAWNPDYNGRPIVSKAATKLLMDIYPERVRGWIKEHGGLSPRMMYLTGEELAAMVQPCQDEPRKQPDARKQADARKPSPSVPRRPPQGFVAADYFGAR